MTSRPSIERVAHRGASKERLENTLAAFQTALDRGADAVELDVHLSRDGVVVVHHDEQAGGQQLADLDWVQIAQIPLKHNERIPRLEDVLRTIGDRAQVYIELKGRGVADAVIACARTHGRRYAVHAFDHSAVGSPGTELEFAL